jgi:1-acyl-sn-glycerol-3-phosphate acyltransferase
LEKIKNKVRVAPMLQNMNQKSFSIAKENTIRGKIFRKFLRFLVAPILRAIWLKKVEGKENLPAKGAYILACNHQSYLDFLLLISAFPNILIRFLAAEKFYDHKYSKFVMEYSGQIKVNRKSKNGKKRVIKKGTDLLKNGQILAIFPQGTRSRDGKITKTFTGVAKFALNARVPIVPVGIRGAFYCWPPGKKPKYKKQVSIYIGKPIELSQHFKGNSPESCLREITSDVMMEISRLAKKEYNRES